jgi:xanthine dehydrogenase YagS FAD-binding subunit
MTPFHYERAPDTSAAVRLLRPGASYLAGGTNLVDLMRETVAQPAALVDVSGLSETIEERSDGGLVIGAGVKNTALASHPAVRARYPMLPRALLAGASAQIRNMASVGGNVMQRTRCHYFYDLAARCNKRTPGAGCDALEGFNRIHAILGASADCVATHPSDMCVALAALDATVQLAGPDGLRSLQLVDLHRLPGDRPDIETELRPGERSQRSSCRPCRSRRARPTARCAIGGATPSPWFRWSRPSIWRRTARCARCGWRSAASRPSRGGP